MTFDVPPPPDTSENAWELHAEGAIGAVVVPYVGPDADVVLLDPVWAAGVLPHPVAARAHLVGPSDLHASLAVEMSREHFGQLGVGEAVVGWAPAWAAVWGGLADVPVTRDRELHPEDRVAVHEPVLSRHFLPQHMAGVGLGARPGDVVHGRVGVAWASPTADAPWVWSRVAVHPLGPLPEREAEPLPGDARVQVAGGAARLDSEALGDEVMLSGGVDVAASRTMGGAEVVYARRDSTGALEALAYAAQAVPVSSDDRWDMLLYVRGSRATGIVEGEAVRYGLTPRLAFRQLSWNFEVFAEGWLSWEQADSSPGVAVIDGGERDNHAAALGARVVL